VKGLTQNHYSIPNVCYEGLINLLDLIGMQWVVQNQNQWLYNQTLDKNNSSCERKKLYTIRSSRS